MHWVVWTKLSCDSEQWSSSVLPWVNRASPPCQNRNKPVDFCLTFVVCFYVVENVFCWCDLALGMCKHLFLCGPLLHLYGHCYFYVIVLWEAFEKFLRIWEDKCACRSARNEQVVAFFVCSQNYAGQSRLCPCKKGQKFRVLLTCATLLTVAGPRDIKWAESFQSTVR